MEDMKRRLVVLGAGESGTGAAILAEMMVQRCHLEHPPASRALEVGYLYYHRQILDVEQRHKQQ